MPAKLTIQEHVENFMSDRSSSAGARKYNRSLTVAVREGINPDWFMEWNRLILQGKDPILVKDARSPDGYRVQEGTGPTPTLEDRNKALKFLVERGWGQAVQQIMLDAELRGQMATLNATLDFQQVGQLSDEQLQGLLQVLGPRAELPAPKVLPVIDAESSEPEDED